jgi:hypothetical protein
MRGIIVAEPNSRIPGTTDPGAHFRACWNTTISKAQAIQIKNALLNSLNGGSVQIVTNYSVLKEA